ncbi:MAG: hypothetical protein Q7T97_17125 [Burkholderiaceae bacterium]|nr:hypothetical protein [Burkholderiaceae bacterium]
MLSLIGTFSCLSANAGFVSASFGTLELDQQTTFMRHQADARATADEQSLPIPFSGVLSAMSAPQGDWANAYSIAAYSFSASELRADVSRLDNAGPSFVELNGAWLFSMTEQAHVVATGFFDVQSVGHASINALRATLFLISKSPVSDRPAGLRPNIGVVG